MAHSRNLFLDIAQTLKALLPNQKKTIEQNTWIITFQGFIILTSLSLNLILIPYSKVT